ncbi:hypothetical protein N7492_007572 [Penicillium capsulatum]|uniref:DUF7704 domain-containing protein n=1 Tax=Penicillium capsulatum TaxID=69766 RepID=A0A9W9I481_9EURO|nr:hypothetical protein N7492_007572 [Penicillium capsulatum]KAJ6117406.1 hypothetical protein N7512_007131 [Penicillium capsulatum]
MPTILPPWPHLLFGVLEPLSLIAGSLAPLYDLEGFIAGQTPHPDPPTTHPSSIALALQLVNLYSLMFLVGVGVLHSTSEPKVVRNYFVGLAIADVGHIYATYLAMGWDAFIDIGAWNALTWGNIGVTGFLFVNRIAHLMGMFEPAKAPKVPSKRE